jgi:hypothetical protein
MNLEEIKKWADMEVGNAQKTLENQADLVARDLEQKALEIRDGKIWSTDAQNMLGRMNMLWDLKKEVDMLQNKVDMLEQIKE